MGVEELDVAARSHGLLDGGVCGLQYIAQDAALLILERVVMGYELTQLVLGQLLGCGMRVPAHETNHGVGRGGQQPDDRAHQCGEAVQNGCYGHRQPCGVLQREAFGYELAEHQGQVGDDQRHHDQGGCLGRFLAEADSFEIRRQVRRQGGATVGGGEESGDCHADLDGSEESVGVSRHGRDSRAARTLALELGQLALAERDQRDLRR